MKEPKLVLFGAGKIGRSFIGQLFSLGGYEVVFVDIFKPIIDELNRRKSYNVIIKAEIEKILPIKNVRGVYAGNKQEVIEEISNADILAVSIGQKGLSTVMPVLAESLLQRYKQDKDSKLDIVIAENLRNAAEYFRTELRRILPAEYPLDQLIGLVETSIGKMVPIMTNKDMDIDILQVFAEPYNTLILDKNAFKNPIPIIDGLSPKENMKAWVDRKLFIHNLGHAATAYIGYFSNPWFKYLHEVLAVPEIFESVRLAMLQSADILLKKYPSEFTYEDLNAHINDLLSRFQNKFLGDTVFRVGCDLSRKLGSEDRLAGAIKASITLELPYDKILYVLICGCFFRAIDEQGNMLKEDAEFITEYKENVHKILKEVCRFDEKTNLQLFKEVDIILKSLRVL
jgi:mannitol-1-phosphate 5-dehydrogenase